MDNANATLLITGSGFLLSFAIAIFALFRFVAGSADKVRGDLDKLRVAMVAEINTREASAVAENRAIRTEMDLKLDRLTAVQDRARHDDKATHTGQYLKLEQAVMEISRTAVRKEDMNRMEKTLDTLSEKVGRQAVLESQLSDLIKKLEKVEPMLMQIQARGANI